MTQHTKDDCLAGAVKTPASPDFDGLLPCPFCGGKAELMLDGTQPDVTCTGDCGIEYSVQVSDFFTEEERYKDPDFKWRDRPEYNYGVGGMKRAREVLTKFWNTRANACKVEVVTVEEQSRILIDIAQHGVYFIEKYIKDNGLKIMKENV